ncbi:MAG: tripartite tricarboxylate transporter TctB family protein [Variibacter sp.]
MTDNSHSASGRGPAHRDVELGVALASAIFALVVIYGSLQVGVDWAEDGPKAGFFPFYVAVIILIASIVNFVQVLKEIPRSRLFAEWGQLSQVVSVVIPTAIYVALVPFAGIYVASALLIAFFMRWFGKYGWPSILAIAIGLPVVTFFVFEEWFLVPLPKGPLEAYLGY